MKTLLICGILSLWTYAQAIGPIDVEIDQNMKPANVLEKLESLTKRVNNEKRAFTLPANYGADLKTNLGPTHVLKGIRSGAPTLTTLCHKVTAVPAKYTDVNKFKPPIDANFFKKFSEVYGIPVIGSAKVSDEGIKRMCYTAAFFLADRYDIRQACYSFWIRFIVIAQQEVITDIPIYSDLGGLEDRAKGLGPTADRPAVSAADENLRCEDSSIDLWYDQDVAGHEIAHMLHVICGLHVLSGFEQRVTAAYKQQVVGKGKWYGTYAAKSEKEYLATVVQMYLEINKNPQYIKYNVHTRNGLIKYDPLAAKLVEELLPCVARGDREYIKRCDWKYGACENDFVKKYDQDDKLQSSCDVVASEHSYTVEKCIKLACTHSSILFMFRGDRCKVLKCLKGEAYDGLYMDTTMGYNIYRNDKGLKTLDLQAELAQDLSSMCTQRKSSCSVTTKRKAGPVGITQEQCEAAGFCWRVKKSLCYYPNQDASDKSCDCDVMLEMKFCETNMAYMALKCPNMCGFSDRIHNIDRAQVEQMCQDKEMNCGSWTARKTCDAYLKETCRISCQLCKAPTSIPGL